jgi:RsiW-degrading membrane proteinase PrsW (M82 family)
MQFTSLVLPILAPVLFWAAYHYYKDRHQPEPVANLLLCFFLGIGASYFSILAYSALGSIGLRFDAYELAAFVSVTIAALFHGVYDFLVIAFPTTALPLAAGLILAIWIWRLVVIRRIRMAEGHLPR